MQSLHGDRVRASGWGALALRAEISPGQVPADQVRTAASQGAAVFLSAPSPFRIPAVIVRYVGKSGTTYDGDGPLRIGTILTVTERTGNIGRGSHPSAESRGHHSRPPWQASVASAVLPMIQETEVTSMADELARAYGVTAAAARATEQALAELERGHVGVATTWRRILNALNRMSADVQARRPAG